MRYSAVKACTMSRTNSPEHLESQNVSGTPRKQPSQDNTKKTDNKFKAELKSSIPKPVGLLNTSDFNLRAASTNKSLARISKPSATQLVCKTSSTRTKHSRSHSVITVASKPYISSAAHRLSPSSTNKNDTISKIEIGRANPQVTGTSICNQRTKPKEKSNNVLHLKNKIMKIQNKLLNSDVSQLDLTPETKERQKLINLFTTDCSNSPTNQENNVSGAGEIFLDNFRVAENIEDTSEAVNDLASRIRTVQSSSMDLCREVVLQKEKLINDCLSKIENISQNNFENIRNELKETLTSLNHEGNQLTTKLDILEGQQLEVIGSLVSDITHLIQQKHKLIDENKRLSITQDKYHTDLQHKIDLLTSENENVSKKLTDTVEQFKTEKAKMEANINSSKLCNQTVIATRRSLLNSEKTLNAQENKIAALETLSKKLEHEIKVRESNLEKELKKYKSVTSKSQEQNQEIQEIKTQLQNELGGKLQLEHYLKSFETKIQDLELQLQEERRNKCAAENEVEKISKDYSQLQEDYKIKLEMSNKSVESSENLSKRIYEEMIDNHSQEIQMKDVEIKLLKEQISDLAEQLEKLNSKIMFEAKQRSEYTEEASSLHTQLTNLRHTLQDVTKEKEEMEKIMVQRTLELEVRDRVLHAQTRSRVVREELIHILKTKDENQEEISNIFSAKIINKEKILEKDYKNVCFSSGKMSESFTMLEKKQFMIISLEKRLKELEGIHERTEFQRIKYEARINQLEQALYEKCLAIPGISRIFAQ